ncbi:MAG: SDR family NAD(P)-dependent oxidoreductase, partial [Gammaproteobacteria bacterium]|nr:SDR family NAD(P)-dependent oxidoreductase [Gammaproteobacteria bacterium]
MQLDGRVAAITGGTAGIGRAIAEAFLDAGARVALMARNAERGRQVAAELGGADRVLFVAGDATVQADVEGFVDAAAEALGPVDVLVNNAGGASDLQPLVKISDEEWDHVLRWNLYSTFWATRRALPGMVERGWGRVINVSSVEGKHGKPVFTAYTAAKHAINGLTKSVAREVGTAGVTVNAICPGLVITDIIRENGAAAAEAMGMTFDEMVAAFSKDSAIERPVTVEEVAALALLLAS